jgi:hypothetical protein
VLFPFSGFDNALKGWLPMVINDMVAAERESRKAF